jgi:hypothetical protein
MKVYKINTDGSSVAVTSETPLSDEEVIKKAYDKDIIDTDNANVEDITEDDDERQAFADVTYQI